MVPRLTLPNKTIEYRFVRGENPNVKEQPVQEYLTASSGILGQINLKQ